MQSFSLNYLVVPNFCFYKSKKYILYKIFQITLHTKSVEIERSHKSSLTIAIDVEVLHKFDFVVQKQETSHYHNILIVRPTQK